MLALLYGFSDMIDATKYTTEKYLLGVVIHGNTQCCNLYLLPMQFISRRTWFLLVTLGISVYVAGLPVTVMDIDAAQYASISREMALSGNYLTVEHRNHDYLDKPPLLFWVTALSFKVFGVSTIAYKLPSFLFILLGFYATFRLGARLYDKRIGILSAMVLASCQAFIYFTNDVRTDAILAASVICAVWQIVEFSYTKKARHFFFGFTALALAMLAKGPIGLMMPLIALGSYFIGKRDFKMLFQWYWLGGAALVLVLLSPMLLGLYRQYGMEGIKFYFWTQSFGRLTGENTFKDSSGYFFFIHTFLWAFLPWMLIACWGIGANLARIVTKRFQRKDRGFAPEMLLLGGIILPFIALSCSHYKLPHYIFVFFPLVAVLTAKTIYELIEDPGEQRALTIFTRIQFALCIGAWVFAAVCMIAFFPCRNILVWLAMIFCAFMTFYFTRKNHSSFIRLVIPSLWAILGVNLMLNIHFFPHLLSYQSGSTAATIVRKNNIPKGRFFAYRIQNHSADFYMERIIPNLDSAQLFDALQKGDAWIYTEAPGIKLMQTMGFSPSIVDSISHMHITKVTSRFLFYKTRKKTLGKQYIVRVERKI
jgi:4-amino-4-deoxy-L-arabinose transferase-like glycosyltransferase